jgi:protein translocase SecG subunit
MNILIFQIAQIVLCVLAVVAVLMQPKNENLGGSAFGGLSGGETYKSRRGIEQILHYGTIVLIVLIAANSLLLVKLS